jgi:hypothetical protein
MTELLPRTLMKIMNLELTEYELPSVNMLSSAQSLAKLASKLSDKDDGSIISSETWEELHHEPKVVREN